jgi:hemoglobin
MPEKSLFEAVGGYLTLRRVHKIFYDKIYLDPWLGLFFAGISQKLLEDQQTDFMAKVLGGPSRYCGRKPVPAHSHILITDEMFDLRSAILGQSLAETGAAPELAQQWLAKDEAFRRRLTKTSAAECKKRFGTDELVIHPKPPKRRLA